MNGELAQRETWEDLAEVLNSDHAPFGVWLAVAVKCARENQTGLELGLVKHRFHVRRFMRAGWNIERRTDPCGQCPVGTCMF